ncbi:hypothetical protein QE418_000543 [Microbacterium testaceum]|uniref:hypothetical protein n=1 Tax=Microbacterium TaxID=33882 RepID=UPI0027864041|nr:MULTISPECIES: hypothetical protein [Microbacterium]MDQ1111095.1 hypothetical protein [Microbacterium testaceum]MDR6098363.1 hypothetical protein [Microbacterium sp. SORGH_AS_0454]
MNDFTASNGVRVVNLGGKWDQSLFQFAGEIPGLADEICQVREVVFQDPDVIALREFFQAESDERLGRWRWPENPDYVVYPCSVKTRVRVLRESGTGDLEWVDQGDGRSYEFVHAARAYFDAHPEPKPWHDSVEGEVWILMFSNSAHAWIVNGGYFQSAKTLTNIAKTDTGIISARRIYPEVEA